MNENPYEPPSDGSPPQRQPRMDDLAWLMLGIAMLVVPNVTMHSPPYDFSGAILVVSLLGCLLAIRRGLRWLS